MKILLKQDVETLGYAGEVHEVAPGYGRNYLIPRGLAEKATPGVMRAAESWRKSAEIRRAQIRKEHEALMERINEVTLNFTAKAGEQGKLYGSVTSAAITDELNQELGIELDRRKVDSAPLRQVGEHKVSVILSRDYRARITVNIHPEGEETVEESAEPEELEDSQEELAEVEGASDEGQLDIEADTSVDWETEWEEEATEEM